MTCDEIANMRHQNQNAKQGQNQDAKQGQQDNKQDQNKANRLVRLARRSFVA